MTQIDLADGVGTRYNLATAEQITLLLSTIYQNKELYPLLFSALPQSGVSGSLKDRMKKTALEKIVYAKTGTMHDISSLSGYLINPNGRPIIFSIIINGINKPIGKAKAVEEQILSLVDQEINGDSPAHSDFG
jgi:D-alanyl-D-alanine carboxypeptidase/D-alanyl-D-alanine-endopeptidase (penicillin-binding protein 4)